MHKLFAYYVRNFVMNPMADVIKFESSHETGKTTAQLLQGKRVELLQAIGLPSDKKGRLGDLRTSECRRQKETGFRGAIVVEATMKAGALNFGEGMGDVRGSIGVFLCRDMAAAGMNFEVEAQ